MFGSFRFLLAVMVVITHLGGIELVAGIAVWGFFMLSGFLMTAVLNEKYGFDSGGLLRFAFSRSMRLLPTYWISLLLTLLVFWLVADRIDPRLMNTSWAPPSSLRDVLANILIVGHTTFGIGRIENAISPSAWAIDVEILMYACSAFAIARSLKAARLAFAITLLAFPVLWLLAKQVLGRGDMQLANELIYSFLPAALLPYSIGSWLWFQRRHFPEWLASTKCGVVLVVLGTVCIFGVSKVSVTAVFVTSLPLLALLIAGLSLTKTQRLAKVDAFLGLMSYPIYLLHWLGGLLAVSLLPGSWDLFYAEGKFIKLTPLGFLAGTVITLIGAALFAGLLEARVEKLRHHFARRRLSNPQTSMG